MNRIFLFAIIAISLICTNCKTISKTGDGANNQAIKVEEANKSYVEENGMLVGKIEREQLEDGEYNEWFKPRYEAYEVSDIDAKSLTNLMSGVDVTIVMGTWCPDSRREVPNFYKIMDNLNLSSTIELIAVDRSKITPQGFTSGLKIQRVPTFIFTKDNTELGRIVEYPIESLEKDMIKILSGEDYSHAYER
ncbi:MAG: thioredoxin family protein [Leeuwenhoekiella sp.]